MSYINGAADLFLSYGFERLASQEFTKDSLVVMVDVYDMGKPLNAFGIYCAQRPADETRRQAGTEAVIFPPYQALMFKDRFYVKVNISQGKLENETALDLLQKVAAHLAGTAGYPQECALLPGKDRKPDSFAYSRQRFSGLSELYSCVSAEYQSPGFGSYTCFAVAGLNKDELEAMWETIAGKWKTDSAKGEDICYRLIPQKGYIGAIKKKGTILGISGIRQKSRLFEMMERLKRQEKIGETE